MWVWLSIATISTPQLSPIFSNYGESKIVVIGDLCLCIGSNDDRIRTVDASAKSFNDLIRSRFDMQHNEELFMLTNPGKNRPIFFMTLIRDPTRPKCWPGHAAIRDPGLPGHGTQFAS